MTRIGIGRSEVSRGYGGLKAWEVRKVKRFVRFVRSWRSKILGG
jgi:hypothetical protein